MEDSEADIVNILEKKIVYKYHKDGEKIKIGADPCTIDRIIKNKDTWNENEELYLPLMAMNLNIKTEPKQYKKYLSELPESHILFYDWRFNEETRLKLIRIICENEWNVSPQIAFVCTPHLGVLFNMLFPDIKIEIIDVNTQILKVAETYINKNAVLTNCDIKEALFNRRYSTIIYDPPLYLSYYKKIIDIAELTLEDNGNLFYVYPNIDLRADYCERILIQKELANKDLMINSIIDDILEYDVPQFEKNTYRFLGSDCEFDWRKHQLFHITKGPKSSDLSASANSILYDINEWKIYYFNKRAVALKKSDLIQSKKLPELLSIYEDDTYVLKSVSARHANRKKINVWVSNNVVYNATNLYLVDKIFEMLVENPETSKLTIEKNLEDIYGLVIVDSVKMFIDKIFNILV
ncbi:MAG: hypothetical protein ACLUNT_02175 [Eubacterium ventriosum]